MSINHPNRVVVALATIALVLLVVATVNTVGATAAAVVGSGVRQYNTQKYYRGGSVRGARATKRRNLSERSEKTSKSSKLTKAQASDTDVVAPTGRDGNNATTTADDDFSTDEFEDENNSTAIIIDTNFTQDDDAGELGFADDDVPIDDNSNSTTTTTISNITPPVFVRTPISNELNPAVAVAASDGEEEATNDASCSAAPLCTRNGLTGDCCPTSEGVFLSCCAKNFGSLPEPAAPAPAVVEGED